MTGRCDDLIGCAFLLFSALGCWPISLAVSAPVKYDSVQVRTYAVSAHPISCRFPLMCLPHIRSFCRNHILHPPQFFGKREERTFTIRPGPTWGPHLDHTHGYHPPSWTTPTGTHPPSWTTSYRYRLVPRCGPSLGPHLLTSLTAASRTPFTGTPITHTPYTTSVYCGTPDDSGRAGVYPGGGRREGGVPGCGVPG